MTASPQSLANIFSDRLIHAGAEFSPSPAEGVLDFVLDGLYFRVIVLGEAETIESVAVFREGDVTDEEAALFSNGIAEPDISEEEAAAIAHAQRLAIEHVAAEFDGEYPLEEDADA